ncbi:AAA family ATPase [Kineococcus aurantiacus]|uniref:DNA-binding NarL/FixJ family response regulator/RecA/RadA recombinase n=1 Tax=Kineococcus aurantiacus TaxID=37633 RepID=A0A7Y9J0N3_9ACTN|nr:DNA-binding NarL/FixJ family response regulator/RecA/RadA recombinase [Kineococcus aurantiacus]
MIGRERELARFDQLLTALRAGGGRGGAVLVEGEAGIGKTTLATAVARTAQDAGFLVLRCQGFESEAATGFTGLHELLHPVLDQVDALPPRQRSALLTALGLQVGPSPDRLLIGLAVLGLLEEAAAQRPVLLQVEDAHWLDASTAGVVAFVARRLGGAPVLLVATARRDATASASASALEEVAEVLPLGPLDDDDAQRLLDSLHPLEPDLGATARRRVLDEAHGNPLALREFAAALSGGTPLTSGPLPTTRRLERAFLDALAPLPASSRTMLLLAAAGEDLLVAELLDAAAALGLDPQDLDRLGREGLVTTTGERAQLRHPLVRSAVHGAASSAERFRVHQALAAASRDPGRAAWHRAAAVPDRDEAVAAELEAAGTLAAERGARSEAAAALRRAAELTPDPSQRATRLLSAAQYLRQAGATVEAAATLDAAAALVSAPQERFQVAYLRSMLGIAAGEAPHDTGRFVQEALQLDDELAADRTTDPAQRVVVLANAAFHAANQATDATWRRAVHDRLAALDAGFPHPLQQVALAVADPLAHPRVRDGLPRLLATFADEPYMLLALGQAAERLQDLPVAQAAWSRAAEAFHRAGSPGDEGQALNGLASVRLVRGQLAEALQDAENAHRTAVDVGMAMVAASASATAARALALTGRPGEAAEALGRVRAVGAVDAVPQVPAGASWAAGLIALQERRFEDALAELLDVGTYPLFAAWSVADLAEAAAGAGAPAQALDVLERVAPAAELFGSDHLRLLVHRARALLLDPAAEEHFVAALAAAERAEAPVELARTQLAYGEWLRREQRPVDARPVLAAAVGGFERRGARSLAERAAQELRAAGGAVRVGDVRPGSGAPLTAQELQIARLAAQGMSNKEIADQLYLSHRTVGAHLYKLFPKLGITSRARLRAALADLDLLGPSAG